jgi:hypothetical protein
MLLSAPSFSPVFAEFSLVFVFITYRFILWMILALIFLITLNYLGILFCSWVTG